MMQFRAPAPTRHACAGHARRVRGMQLAVRAHTPPAPSPTLYVPGSYENQAIDILLGTTMQAQQATSCYNNCLATGIALGRATTVLGLEGFELVFGHLASNREGVSAEVPHVWVTYQGPSQKYIIDATLSDVLPTEELFNFKGKLKYVPGRAGNPMPSVGLPTEADSQDKLEYWVEHQEEYLASMAAADPNTPQAAAALLCHVLAEALMPVKDDLQQLLKQGSKA